MTSAARAAAAAAPAPAPPAGVATAGAPDVNLEKTAFGVPSVQTLRAAGTLPPATLAPVAAPATARATARASAASHSAAGEPDADAKTVIDMGPPSAMQIEAAVAAAALAAPVSPGAAVGGGPASPPIGVAPTMAADADASGDVSRQVALKTSEMEATPPPEAPGTTGAPVGFPGAYIYALKYFFNSTSGSAQRRRDRRALEVEHKTVSAARAVDLAALGEAAYVAKLSRPDLGPLWERLRETDERKEDLERRREEVEKENTAREASLDQQEREAQAAMMASREATTVVQAELGSLRAQEKVAQKEASDAQKRMDAEGRRIHEAEQKLLTNPPNAQALHADIVQARQNTTAAQAALTAAQKTVAELAEPVAQKAAQLQALETESAGRARTLADIVATRKTHAAEVTARLGEFQTRIGVEDERRRAAAQEAGQVLVGTRASSPALATAYEAVATRDADIARIDGQLHELADADAAVDAELLSRGKVTLAVVIAAPIGLVLLIVLLVVLLGD
ncbi:MAG TPA: hypothetical protein VG389_00770 [Myxococcota bacterium]|jgi:hypothetical protein|nr:hypothetical protein [Myxococcota bacterium]